ncbi:hypothetical protein NYF14_14485 [Sphingobium sp. 10 DY56-G10]|uniref:hypothetical protein n=1 Tax=Sphingomonadales TaxID=204457 RepID=UPI0012EAA322|nr:hypothetical protein [Sphingomonas sp. SKA58]
MTWLQSEWPLIAKALAVQAPHMGSHVLMAYDTAIVGSGILLMLNEVAQADLTAGMNSAAPYANCTHPVRTAVIDGLLGDLASYLPRKASTPS